MIIISSSWRVDVRNLIKNSVSSFAVFLTWIQKISFRGEMFTNMILIIITRWNKNACSYL